MAKKKHMIAFNYYGGKYYFLDELYKYFPYHLHFLDLFGGSFTVTLNKKPSKLDTVNDINDSIINFFKVLREKPADLLRVLELTLVRKNSAYETS